MQKISIEDIVNAHAFIIAEMTRRDMQHRPHDKLDDMSEKFNKQYGRSYYQGQMVVTLPFMTDMTDVTKNMAEGSVLELGCGSGRGLCVLQNSDIVAQGIDISKDAIKICQARGVSADEGDAQDLSAFEDSSFDNVVSLHLLEHLDDMNKCLKEAHRVAKSRSIHLVPLGKRGDKSHKAEFSKLDDFIKILPDLGCLRKVSRNNNTNCATVVYYKDVPTKVAMRDFGSFMITPDFISLVGGAVKTSDEPRDIDIVIRKAERDTPLEIAIRNTFAEKERDKLRYIYNASGPHGDNVPLYDLVAVAKFDGVKLISIEKKDFAPITYFTPLKTKGGYSTQEFFDENTFWDFWASGLVDRGLAVERKFNGFRTVLEKKGDEVVIYFEDSKNNRAAIMPSVVKELKGISGDFILDAEMGEMRGGKSVPRVELQRWTGDDPGPDTNVKIHVFDALYHDGKDLHTEPWNVRQKALGKVFSKSFKHIEKVKPTIVHDKAALMAAVRKVQKMPMSEGAVIKVIDSDYPLTGKTNLWSKVKTYIEIKCLAHDKKKAGSSAFNYACALGPVDKDKFKRTIDYDGKTYANLQWTFNTKLDAKVGDIITVAVSEFLWRETDKGIEVGWVAPKVRDIDLDRKSPHTPEEAKTITQKGNVLQLLKVLGYRCEECGWKGKSEETKPGPHGARCPACGKDLLNPYGPDDQRVDIDKQSKKSMSDLKEEMAGKFVLQEHQRGKSIHSDLRLHITEPNSLEYLIGLTLDTPGNAAQRSKVLSNQQGDRILIQFKERQPLAWLTFEGETKSGDETGEEPEPGATEHNPGIFTIKDKGSWKAGKVDPHYMEFWFDGNKLKGRWILTYAPVGGSRVWLLSKPKDQTMESEKAMSFKKFVPIRKLDEERQILYGVVMEPDEVDAQGDTVSKEQIEKACHDYMIAYAKGRSRIGLMHKYDVTPSTAIIECYLTKQNESWNGSKVKEGSWVMGTKVFNKKLWKLVKDRKLTGYSIGGEGRRI